MSMKLFTAITDALGEFVSEGEMICCDLIPEKGEPGFIRYWTFNPATKDFELCEFVRQTKEFWRIMNET